MGYGPWGLDFWELLILVWLVIWIFKPRESRQWDRMFADFSAQHEKEKAAVEDSLNAYEADLGKAEARIDPLEEHIRVLERIVTDEHKTRSLADEIDSLDSR